MKVRWIGFFSAYMFVLVLFALAITSYTFYRRNTVLEKLAVKDFPEIPIKNHLGVYKTINDYKGKIILVDFWFSTCPRCLDEMKYFPALLNRYDDLVIMSFSVDSESHTKKVLENKRNPWNFLITDNPRWTFYNVDKKEKNGYVDLLKVNSFPSYFLIDTEGKLISSPRNAIYGVEKEMSGIFSLRLSFDNYFDEYDVKDVVKAFGLYNLIVLGFLLVWVTVLKDKFKRA